MEKKYNTLGQVNPDGTFSICDKQNMNTFLSAHKGKNVMLELKVFKESGNGIKAYFYGVVIPRAQQGFDYLGEIYTKEQTERELKLQSPVTLIETLNEETGQWEQTTKGLSELSSLEWSRFIEDVNRFCAMELDVILPDPTKFKNEQLL